MLKQLLMVGALLFSDPYVNDRQGYVYTPNGSKISGLFYDGGINDYLGSTDYVGNDYENITMLARGNPTYNCFSYAFYKTSSDNNCHMPSGVSIYREDQSYVESGGYVGDRIVYFDRSGNPVHAGVVVARTGYPISSGTSDLSKILVDSKWDYGPVYRHAGNNCPYDHIHSQFFGSFTYYRLNTNHVHDFSYAYSGDEYVGHVASCACGLTIDQPCHLYEGKCICCEQNESENKIKLSTSLNKSIEQTEYINNQLILSDNDYQYLMGELKNE